MQVHLQMQRHAITLTRSVGQVKIFTQSCTGTGSTGWETYDHIACSCLKQALLFFVDRIHRQCRGLAAWENDCLRIAWCTSLGFIDWCCRQAIWHQELSPAVCCTWDHVHRMALYGLYISANGVTDSRGQFDPVTSVARWNPLNDTQRSTHLMETVLSHNTLE